MRRAVRDPRPGVSSAAGGLSVEWLALAAALVIVLAGVATSIGPRVGDAVADAFCRITSTLGSDCGTPIAADVPGGDGPDGGTTTDDGTGGVGPTGDGPTGQDGSDGDTDGTGEDGGDDPAGPDPVWPPDDMPVDEALELLLGQTEMGREALRLAEEWGYEIVFEDGGGSYHSADSRRITLDSERDAAQLYGTFIHEMGHARYNHEGLRADPNEVDRDAFVESKLREEADATVDQIRAVQEAQEFFGDRFPSHSRQEAYEEILAESGEQAAADYIYEYFANDAHTSNTGEQYTDYYGRVWDDSQSSGGSWWCLWLCG
ncbi:hypothetical protein FTX61_03415 [Nitriliruptoraceae bacterium ZYF776]|nr:hypothetical protein [Profundirhabdus halotolerans]